MEKKKKGRGGRGGIEPPRLPKYFTCREDRRKKEAKGKKKKKKEGEGGHIPTSREPDFSSLSNALLKKEEGGGKSLRVREKGKGGGSLGG